MSIVLADPLDSDFPIERAFDVCPACSGDAYFMGTLAARNWFSCAHCQHRFWYHTWPHEGVQHAQPH